MSIFSWTANDVILEQTLARMYKEFRSENIMKKKKKGKTKIKKQADKKSLLISIIREFWKDNSATSLRSWAMNKADEDDSQYDWDIAKNCVILEDF